MSDHAKCPAKTCIKSGFVSRQKVIPPHELLIGNLSSGHKRFALARIFEKPYRFLAISKPEKGELADTRREDLSRKLRNVGWKAATAYGSRQSLKSEHRLTQASLPFPDTSHRLNKLRDASEQPQSWQSYSAFYMPHAVTQRWDLIEYCELPRNGLNKIAPYCQVFGIGPAAKNLLPGRCHCRR